ncbi:hypothetical protein HEP87_61395 [Streptomyces sp. S1D4-11]
MNATAAAAIPLSQARPGQGGLALGASEAGHGEQADQEAHEDGDGVEEDEFLLLVSRRDDDECGCGQVDHDGPVRRVVAVAPAEHRRQHARLLGRTGQGLQQAGGLGLEGGAGGGEQQQ